MLIVKMNPHVYPCSSEMALTIPTRCVSLEQTRQHHFDINLTCSRHGIAEELFTWRLAMITFTNY
jgi:hypothetical protein